MSFWKRLFKRTCEIDASPAPSTPAQKYFQKYQAFVQIMAATDAAGDLLERLRRQLAADQGLEAGRLQEDCTDLLGHLAQALELLPQFCQQPPESLQAAYAMLAGRIEAVFAAAPGTPSSAVDLAILRQTLQPLLCASQPQDSSPSPAVSACTCLEDLLAALTELRLQEMFCLSLRSRIGKKQAVSLVTGRLVPILVIDVGGGLASSKATVNLEDITSIPYKAFLTGMLSIPWPKARPVDMKGFISVVGVTSTTPRAEDQLQKISLAILAKEYMNFSLCLGYHASTIEAYVGEKPRSNYLRFHYQGGAASVERRVRRLRLIGGILTRLGFEAKISGDLLDARKTGEGREACLKMLEILGRLEVFTKQMDMVMSDDEVVLGYIEDFLANHC